MPEFFVTKEGQTILIHRDMHLSEVIALVENHDLTSATPEWKALTKVVKARGYKNIRDLLSERSSQPTQSKNFLITLAAFEEEIAAIAEANGGLKHVHPVEWFLNHWKPPSYHVPGWHDPRKNMSLQDVLELLIECPPNKLRLINQGRYKQLRLWVERNFRLTISDFYRYFLTHRIPAIINLKRCLLEEKQRRTACEAAEAAAREEGGLPPPPECPSEGRPDLQ